MNLLEAFLILRDGAENNTSAAYDDRELSGTLPLTTETCAAFACLHEKGSLSEIRVDGRFINPGALPTAGSATFRASAPTPFFETIDELISRHPDAPPADFKVYNIVDQDSFVPRYLQTVKLISLLKGIGADATRKRIVLYAKDSTEIPVIYTRSDLREIPGLDEICQKLADSTTDSPENERIKDIYTGLFTQSVYDVVSGISRNRRLPHLIEHFDECLFKFKLAFRVFTDEANEAIERYEDKRAGMIAALNSILGNIQTSLVGVPLAGILALKEMKKTAGMSYENIIIVCAVVIIGTLLLILSWSQGKALDSIKLQHDQLKGEIDKSGGGETKAGGLLVAMKSHYDLVSRLLYAVRVVIMAFIILAVVAFFCRIGPANVKPDSSVPISNPGY